MVKLYGLGSFPEDPLPLQLLGVVQHHGLTMLESPLHLSEPLMDQAVQVALPLLLHEEGHSSLGGRWMLITKTAK